MAFLYESVAMDIDKIYNQILENNKGTSHFMFLFLFFEGVGCGEV